MGAKPLQSVEKVFTLGMLDPAADEAAKKASNEQKALSAQQAASAEQLRVETLQQPKQIASDNFMANKSSQLAKLRLGMNSTITGASTVSPSMVPSTNTDAKTKLGL